MLWKAKVVSFLVSGKTQLISIEIIKSRARVSRIRSNLKFVDVGSFCGVESRANFWSLGRD